MTEIKIPFLKTKAEKHSDPDMLANLKALKLEVLITKELKKIFEKIPSLTGFGDKSDNNYFHLIGEKSASR